MEANLLITPRSKSPAEPPAPPTPSLTLNALSRRPFVPAAALLILGILFHAIAPSTPRLWLALAGAAAALALGMHRRGWISTSCLALAIALTGLAAAQLARFHFPHDHIAAIIGDTPQLAQIELILTQPPRTLSTPSSGGRPLPPRQVTSGEVTRVRTWDGWQPASGALLLSIDQPNASLAYGQRVVAIGTLSRPPPAMNPGQFDWSRYYRQDRVLASLDAPHGENVRIVEPLAIGLPLRAINALRQRARHALSKGFAEQQSLDHALLRALLLGDHDPQLRDVQDDFRKTGTSHHLAISGMHVAILGAFVFGVCRLLRLAPRKAAGVMCGFVLLYGIVALPSPPVWRSIVLCLCFALAVVCRRSVDGVQLLALTAFVLLAAFPLDLFDAGFQLSFGTVLGLMLLATPLARRLHKEDEDERVLRSLGVAPGWFKSVRHWSRRQFTAALAAGVVAWVVSAPLVIQHFDQLNPWTIPASLLLAIPVLLALVAGLLKVVLTLLIPWLAPLWAAAAALPIALMRNLVDGLARLPAGDLPLPALPVAAVLAFYALLALALLPTTRRWLKILSRGGLATACAALVFLPFLAGLGAPRNAGDQLRLTLLSVGAGQCAVVELPSGKTVLIDAGSSTIQDLPRRCLEPFLRRRGVGSVDSIYVSHANLDHFSGVARAAREYDVKRVVVTNAFEAHAAKNAPASQMLADLRTQNAALSQISAGQTIPLDPSTTLQVLWPPPGAQSLSPNDTSQVLKLTCGGRSILFTGDVQQPALESLLRTPAALRADVLIAPHHGSAEPATAAFLAAVGSPTVLASSDRTPTRKQREFDGLAAAQNRTLLRTNQCGAITLRVGKDGAIRFETFLRR
jgi:competence protein ComEC